MNEQVLDPTIQAVPPWLGEIKFCHITCDDAGHSYCGHSENEGFPERAHAAYNGEAICPSCGRPTCPRCAQLCALEDAIYEAGS